MTPATQTVQASIRPHPLGRDDRAARDRRQRPTPMFSRYSLWGGNRRGGRRDQEVQNVFVDRYGPRVLTAALVVVALNVLDAFFTLYFLSYGGKEANPVVEQVLQWGLWPFVILKSLGIGVCVMFLVVAKNFTVARWGMITVILGYGLLLVWHLVLLNVLHG